MATDKLTYKIGADSTPFRNELKKASTAFDRFGRKHSRVISGLKTAGLNAASGIAALGVAAATAVTTAAVALSTKATKSAAGFERAIVSAGAKSAATGDQLRQMEKSAISAASGAEFSALQAADAMGFLAAAGFDVAEQMKALPGVLNLASAGELELAESADLASNVLSQYALNVDELGRVNDVLVLAANSANTSVSQLGEALSYAGPAAAGAGISLEETVAGIGKLSDAGIQGQRAGAAMVQIMAQLTSAAKKMSVPLSGADIASLGLAGSLQKLEAAGLNAQNAGEFFTTRAQVGVQAILQQGIPAVEGLDSALQHAGGTAQEVADKKIDTLQGSINILKGNIDNLLITLGQKFLPAVKSVANIFAQLSVELRENDDLLQDFADGMADATVFAAGLAQGVGYLGSIAIQAMGALSGNFEEATKVADRLNKTLDKATDIAAQFSGEIKAGSPAASDYREKLQALDKEINNVNTSTARRIALQKEFNALRENEKRLNLEASAGAAGALADSRASLISYQENLEQQQAYLRKQAASYGVSESVLGSLGQIDYTGVSAADKSMIQTIRRQYQEIGLQASDARERVALVTRELDKSMEAAEKLEKMGESSTSPTTKITAPKAPKTGTITPIVDNTASIQARDAAIRAGESQAQGVIEGYNRMLAEADASDIFAGYDRMIFEKMHAENAAAMEKMLADQKALSEKWAGIWDQASDKVVSVFADSVGDAFLGVLEGNVDAVKTAVKGLVKELVVLAAKAAILSAIQSSTPGGAIPAALGFATGGYVSGPGTATSDSIPARLSNGEYVVKTAAVNHWGVGFMEAINNMRTPAKSRPQKFATGGLASSNSQNSEQQPIRIINVTDPAEVESVMAGPAGERIVFNILSRKSDQVRSILR